MINLSFTNLSFISRHAGRLRNIVLGLAAVSMIFTPALFTSILFTSTFTLSESKCEAQTQSQARKITFSDDGFAPMFPFVQSKDLPDNITNVQTWRQAKPAGSDGFLRIENGHFVSDAGPVRFVGTNLCFSASFPPSREEATQLAQSLARYGINCVRLHHMDSRDIWGGNSAKNHLSIDPVQLDRLDYLIYQLHQNGIYVNINLHVSRKFDQRDGFTDYDKRPGHDKGLDNFEPRMIEYQKKYAKELLTHVNPYTKLAYINDPGVAMIEINNENSVVASWSWGELDNLPEPYKGTFQGLWNDWLAKKYKTTAELKKAWNCREYPFGEEMVADGCFAENYQFNQGDPRTWELQTDSESKCSYSVYKSTEGMTSGKTVLKLSVEKLGQFSWIPQIHRVGLAVEKDKPYTFRFKIRASMPCTVSTGVRENHDPWGSLGFSRSIQLETQWQQFEFAFLASNDDTRTRLSFSSFKPGITYELTDVSLIPGGYIGLKPGESLEQKTISAPTKGDFALPSQTAKSDVAMFLRDLEETYWQTMFQYVKSLGAQQPVSGTQLQYGYWYPQAELDYCDIHAYWNHPVFPGRPWDGNNWYVNSRALVNSPDRGTLNRLAAVRVIDRPLTVSEYDHPYPNLYCAEGNPMSFAMAAFQDWSGVFQFAWKHDQGYAPQMCTSFFDMAGNQVKIAHLPACWAMFVRGDVKSGPVDFKYTPKMSVEKENQIMADSLTGYHRSLDGLGVDFALSLAVYAGVDLTDLAPSKNRTVKDGVKTIESWDDLPDTLGGAQQKWIKSDSGELYYDFQTPDKGYFIVRSAKSKLFTGFIDGRSFDLGSGITFVPGKTRLDWTTFSMVEATSGRWLITATGLMSNEGMDLEDLGGGRITCGNRWGKAPALCEGIPAELTLPVTDGKVTVYALDQNGNRTVEVPVRRVAGKAVIQLDPKFKTIWYELDIQK